MNFRKSLKADYKKHKFFYLLSFAITLLALFFRVYRAGQVLGFYFDQGRDALHIWDLIHKGDFFLIGPTTGIAGIFRGPFYYYLITPFYWLGQGNPVWPANFLSVLTVVASGVLVYLGIKVFDRTTGIFAAIISGLSFYLIFSSRWLSNPTPMFLLSVLLVFCLFMIMEGKRVYWLGVALVSGLSLFHFGSSGELFYFPAILLFAIWQRKYFPSVKLIIFSIIIFLATASPLVLFDFKNGHLLWNNIKAFIFAKDTFKAGFSEILAIRLDFYRSLFLGEIFTNLNNLTYTILGSVGVGFLLFLPRILKNDKAKLLILLLLSPMIGLLFFQGNAVYGYYLTGYYLIFVLLFALTLGLMWKSLPGKVLVIIFFTFFIWQNVPLAFSRMSDGGDGPTTIILKNQLEAINWIYADASTSFNTDVYVPPVIPYAYDYLYKWYPTTISHQFDRVDELVPSLYTLYEVDPPHPERLQAWLDRQAGIGKVQYEKTFGGITVQKRTRLE